MPESPTWRDATLDVEARTDALLAVMTTAEKVAQLGGYWDDPRGSDELIMPGDVEGRPPFGEAAADGMGQLTRVLGTRPVAAAAGAAAITEAQEVLAGTRLGIPAVAHEECLTGVETLGATIYPIPLAWGATFDPDLVERMAAAIGDDLRAVGVHQGLAPVLDVTRDYRWGRTEETIGEDPYLVGTIGTGYVRGLQHAGVVATLKHYVGYSGSVGGRNHAPVPAGPRELADVYLPPFEHAIRLGEVGSVMNSYSEVDGVPVAGDRRLLTDTLRDELGFTGTVVSDYWSVPFLHTQHRVADGTAAAAALALTAGMDVELPDLAAYRHLTGLVERGDLDPAVLDTAARRVLRQKIALGLLDGDPGSRPTPPAAAIDLDSPRNRDLAREVAEASVVLLANDDGVLPLRGDDRQAPTRIAVVGPVAAEPRALLGCYSYPNHVLPRFPDLGLGLPVDDVATALAAELADADVVVEPGVPLAEPDTSAIPAAVAAATDADVVVAVVGDRAGMFGRGTSGEGSDAVGLDLPGAQGALLDAVLETGTPVVVVVLSGRPYALGRYADRAAALVQAFMPGVEGAAAIAGVLSGRVNPGGHLPVGIPAADGGMPHTYLGPPLRHDGGMSVVGVRQLYPFGHGRSYTTFEVSDLAVDDDGVPTDGEVLASVSVANTGDRAGSTAVQLYAHDPVASVTRPVLELLGYLRVHLEPGESARLRVRAHTDRFSFTGADGARVVEPGEIRLAAGLSSGDLPATATFHLTGPARRPGRGRTLTTEITRA